VLDVQLYFSTNLLASLFSTSQLCCLKCAFVSGIMTLTRTPCELDKMSLFQDLKLKRRKVDSRCSSDGKSLNILNGLAAFNLG